VDLALGIFGAAVFTEPAIAEVKEVVRLIHREGYRVSEKLVSGIGCQASALAPHLLSVLPPETRHPFPGTCFIAAAVYPAFLSAEPALKYDGHCE
jgi:hypothetical protein